MLHIPFRRAALGLALALGAALSAAPALAQADKSVVVEQVPALPAFGLWTSQVIVQAPEPAVSTVRLWPFELTAAPQQQVFQPLPVILGAPELPLIGTGAADITKAWSPSFNYQGVVMRQVVLDRAGRQRAARPMGTPLQAGERFKLRITATFDAVADVDQLLGEPWTSVRTGQVYPKAGMSVAMKPGETIELPMGADEYFVMGPKADERLVVSVRHPKALDAARSNQPAYRQDTATASNYLQLVPKGSFPVIEQVVTQRR